MLDCPAGSVPQLVEWTLKQSGLGAPRPNRNGKDSHPLVVLTTAAAVKLGLPERLEGHDQRHSLRLPDDHPVVKQLAKAKWKLAQRGFGQRQCVQLAILPWGALDARSWLGVASMGPAEVARVLGTYAAR